MARPPRVIHLVENLNVGAIENWLVRMLRHADTRDVPTDWTFYCTLGRPGVLDEQARDLGARVILSPAPLNDWARFVGALRAELRDGAYDVMHAHHDLVSGIYMGASTGLGIRRRIVHVHNADELLPTPSRLKDRLLREPLRRLGLRADRVVGISDHTLETYLDGRPRRPGRDIVHYYGVDPAPFRQERSAHDRGRFRAALGLPPDALILLFGGRLTPEKNPLFTVDVLAELRRQEPRTVGVFAGAGSLEGAVLERAAELQVTDAVRMLGWRNDLHEIMMASDWFILPRPERPLEGFGLAVVEAQLAGLRMLLSPGVPDDPLLPSAVFGRIPLAAGPKAWADAASDMLRGREPSAAAALADLSASAMQLDTALAGLAALHG